MIKTCIFPLETGMHAGPSMTLVKKAKSIGSNVMISRDGFNFFDINSIMSLLSLSFAMGDIIYLKGDNMEILEELIAFINSGLTSDQY